MSDAYVPLGLAEMLHVTLGPVAETLAEEGHRWAGLLHDILAAYQAERDELLVGVYGMDALPIIDSALVAAVDRVSEIIEQPLRENDFTL